MTHYNTSPEIVRCDVFKPSGKWYETIALDMAGYYQDAMVPFDAVALSIEAAGHYQLGQWNFYVAEPYHHAAYPVMIPAGINRAECLTQARKGVEWTIKSKEISNV